MDKQGLANILVRANAFAPFRFLNRGKLPILMYHRFSRGEEFGKTSQAAFESHLRYLTAHYSVISMSEAVNRLKNKDALPKRSAVITIDDGYRDFYEIAFPVLKKFRLPATIYVVTSFVDGKNWIWTDKARYILARTRAGECITKIGSTSLEVKLGDPVSRLKGAGAINSELKKLPDAEKESSLLQLASEMSVAMPDMPPVEFQPFGWDEAREMQSANITVGSHTENHPILTNVDVDSLENELRSSKSMIEDKIQSDEIHFCYPNGNFTSRERDAAERAGYASAVTTELKLCENGDDPFLLPRIAAESEMHRLVQATSGFDRLKS